MKAGLLECLKRNESGSATQMEKSLIERMHIREVIENWVLWRDSGDWERFRTVWHPEGA